MNEKMIPTVSGPGDLYLFGFTNRLTGPEAHTYTGVTTAARARAAGPDVEITALL